MANIVKDLGAVSAYALAVEHGFEGTEAEWALLQMQAGENAQRAENAAYNAEESAHASAGSASSAANSAQAAQAALTNANVEAQKAESAFDSASESAGNAAASAQDAKTSASNAANSATASDASAVRSESAAYRAEAAAQSQAQIDDAVASLEKVWSSRRTLDRLCPAFEASGPLVQCNPVEGYPLGVVSEIVATQTGSDEPSPDNVRPISGWDAATATKCGKNLLDVKQYTNTQTYGITFTTNEDGSVTAEGTNIQGTVNNHSVVVRIYLKAGKYIVSGGKSGAFYTVVSYPKADNKHDFLTGNGTFTMVKDNNALVYLQVANGATVNETIKPMIEYGGVATDYEPYQGETHTTQFSETIYGGRLDWITGVLTVTHRKMVLDENTSIYDNTAIRAGQFMVYITDNKSVGKTTKAYSTHLMWHETHAYNGSKADTVAVYLDHVWMYTPQYPKLTDFKAFLKEQCEAGTPVTVVYELLNPYTIQLTPQQIAALAGVNNIWSDTGDTTVSGRVDPVHVLDGINARLAALEAVAINNI